MPWYLSGGIHQRDFPAGTRPLAFQPGTSQRRANQKGDLAPPTSDRPSRTLARVASEDPLHGPFEMTSRLTDYSSSQGRITSFPPIHFRLQYPSSGASLARTSSSTSAVQCPSFSARRAFQSTLFTWSARMTPVAPWPAGTGTSNGYPFA